MPEDPRAPPPPLFFGGLFGSLGLGSAKRDDLDKLVKAIRGHARSLGGKEETMKFGYDQEQAGKLTKEIVGAMSLALTETEQARRRIENSSSGECLRRLKGATAALAEEVDARRKALKLLAKRLEACGGLDESQWPSDVVKRKALVPNTSGLTRTVTYNGGLLSTAETEKLSKAITEKERTLESSINTIMAECDEAYTDLIGHTEFEAVLHAYEDEMAAMHHDIEQPASVECSLIQRYDKSVEWQRHVRELGTYLGQVKLLMYLRRECLRAARRVARPFEVPDDTGDRSREVTAHGYTRMKGGATNAAIDEEKEKRMVYPRLYTTLRNLYDAIKAYEKDSGKTFEVDINELGVRPNETFMDTIKRELRAVERYGVKVKDGNRVFASPKSHAVVTPIKQNEKSPGFGSSTRKMNVTSSVELGRGFASPNPMAYPTSVKVDDNEHKSNLNFSRCTIELFGPSSGDHMASKSKRGKKDYRAIRQDNRRSALMAKEKEAEMTALKHSGGKSLKAISSKAVAQTKKQLARKMLEDFDKESAATKAKEAKDKSPSGWQEHRTTSLMILSNGLTVHSKPGQFARARTVLSVSPHQTGQRSPLRGLSSHSVRGGLSASPAAVGAKWV